MKAKYGIRALGILAKEYGKGPLLASEISAAEHIPQGFLRFILKELKNNGLLQSKKGKGGGYYLARQPAMISVGQLVRALDGPLILVPCASPTTNERCSDCTDRETCGIRVVFKEASDATASILDNVSLEDFAASQRAAKTSRCLG